MSLYRGDQLVKLDKDGTPIDPAREGHVKWEIVDVTPYIQLPDGAQGQVALLKLLQ